MVAAALAVTALAGGVTGASARGVPPGTTSVEIKGVTFDDNGFLFVVGRVFAQPQQCSKNRRVELQLDEGSGFETRDEGRTTSRAYYGLASPVTGGQRQIRVVALKQKVKVGNKRVTCKRAVGLPVE